MPPGLDAYAVHRPGDIRFFVRRDAPPERIAAAVTRMGAQMSREVIDATLRGRAAAAE